MSNFAKNYGAHFAFNENWYFNYDMMKKRIYDIEAGIPYSGNVEKSCYNSLCCDNSTDCSAGIEFNLSAYIPSANVCRKCDDVVAIPSDCGTCHGACSLNPSLESGDLSAKKIVPVSSNGAVLGDDDGNVEMVYSASAAKAKDDKENNETAKPLRNGWMAVSTSSGDVGGDSDKCQLEVSSADSANGTVLSPPRGIRGATSTPPVSDSVNDFEEIFSREVDRINQFIEERLADLQRHVQANQDAIKSHMDFDYKNLSKAAKKTLKKRGEASLKRTLTHVYQEADHIESYRLLNLTAMIKIIKKRDKVLAKRYGKCYPDLLYSSSVSRILVEFKEKVEDCRRQTELAYSVCLADNDDLEAHCKLANSKNEQTSSAVLHMGLKFGCIIVLLAWFIWDEAIAAATDKRGYNIWNDPALHIYSFFGNIIWYKWLWGVCVYYWTNARINYTTLLRMHKSHTKRYDQIHSEAASHTLIFMVNLILYSKANRGTLGALGSIPPYYFPILLVTIFGVILGYGFIYQLTEAQGVFTHAVVFRVVTAPFSTVTFGDIIAADILTSFVKVLSSGAYGMCYLISGSYKQSDANFHDFGYCQTLPMVKAVGLIAVLPVWFRFAQCLHMVYCEAAPGKIIVWPHTFNAIKYFLGLVIVIISLSYPLHNEEASGSKLVFQVVMAVVLITATIYSTWWDLRMDWGLLDIFPSVQADGKLRCPPKTLLRVKLMNPRTNFYYVAMVVDFLLRALWVVSLIPQNASTPFSVSVADTLYPFLAAVEMMRRCMWKCLRLEWEHVKRIANVHKSDDKAFVALHFHEPVKTMEGSFLCGGDTSKNPWSAAVHWLLGGGSLLAIYLIVSFSTNSI